MKFTTALLALLIPFTAHASWGSSPKADTSEMLALLFGKNTGFTATATTSMKNRKGKESEMGEMQYAFLDGKLRVDIDMTKATAAAKHADDMSAVAGMGLGKMEMLVRSDKQTTYIVYPGLKAYCEAPKTLASKDDSQPKIERTELGKEDAAGHPCTKWKVVITAADGTQHTVLVWAATDLNDFPVKTEIETDDGTVTTIFSNIQLTKPAAAQFDLPANFTKYDSVQDMMMHSMQQMMNGARQ